MVFFFAWLIKGDFGDRFMSAHGAVRCLLLVVLGSVHGLLVVAFGTLHDLLVVVISTKHDLSMVTPGTV